MIKTTGKFIYDPKRQDFRKTYKSRTLIVELQRDQMDLYYQWFLRQKFGQWLTLQRPMFGLHCTIVRGDERIKNENLWKKYQGQSIEIEYDPEKLKRHWTFWSIPVFSTRLEEIRGELGLQAYHDFHITIGRMYDHQLNFFT